MPARAGRRATRARPSKRPRRSQSASESALPPFLPERPEAGQQTVGVEPIPLALLEGSPNNPRRKVQQVDDLAASIAEYGLLQPIVVRRQGDGYEVVAGHRRLAAVRSLGWTDVPAVVRDEAEDRAYLLTLIENLQRQDLSPREEARALEVLVRDRGFTTRQVAAAIKRSQAYVSKRLRVFEDVILAPAVMANQLTVSAAEELLRVNERHRYELLYTAIDKQWDRAQVRQAASGRPLARHTATSTRPRGLSRRVHQFRTLLRDVHPADLTEADRRELRLLFGELGMLARAPKERRKPIIPPLQAS
jgi:ParB family transcriptional regulator, chromosome partitioning protein